MLRRITMRNFVHFEEEQDLKFTSNCPVLFVGASSSGKTATLELIRRCLDSKINSSLTNRVNTNLMAYAFCEFSIDVEHDNDLKDYDENVIAGILIDGKQADNENDKREERNQRGTNDEGNFRSNDEHEEDKEWISTELDKILIDVGTSEDDSLEDTRKDMQEDGKQEDTEDEENSEDNDEDEENEKWDETEQLNSEKNGQMFHKIIIYTYQKKMKCRAKTFLEKQNGQIVDLRENIKLPRRHSKEFLKNGNEKLARNTLKYIREKRGKIYRKKPKLWNIICSTYVGVLSMRGIGTFQYTCSRKISEDQKDKNYMDTCKQAEIINDLMNNEVIDDSKEEGIFKYLTDGKPIKFSKDSNGGIIVEREGKPFPLLKTSVGILEAKQFSLLMAHKKLKTICYEEPDRGMHPQMIQRMKDILHRESKSKTIISVTHSPFLVDSMCCANTYIFCKQEDGIHFIKGYDRAFPKVKSDKPKLAEIEEMQSLLFSSKVLLVEGKTDKVVLQGIFRHIFEKPEEIFESESIEMCANILSHQIVSTGGWSFSKTVNEFCNEIKVTCRVLLDRDVFITTNNRGCIESIEEQEFNHDHFMDKRIWEFLEGDGFDELSQILEKKGTFIWKEGDLEDVILSNIESREKIFKTLEITPKNKKGGNKKRSQLKEDIKNALSNGLTQKQSEELTTIIVKFEDVKRLLKFLGES